LHDAVRADPDAPLWRLLAATGLRRGEALGLKWEDVDLDAGALRVRHNAVMVGSEVVIGEPKLRRLAGDAHSAVVRKSADCPFGAWDARPRAAQNDESASRRTERRTGVPCVEHHERICADRCGRATDFVGRYVRTIWAA
jgi:integrase